jgi:hypothetical protein
MSILHQFHSILLLFSCDVFVLQKVFLHVLLIYPFSHTCTWSKYFVEENIECSDSSMFLTKYTVPGTECYMMVQIVTAI